MRISSLSWSPTVALPWLWGLGFFYSAHVAYTQGWIGFLAFAIPNALGLAGFGAALDRFGPKGDLEPFFMRLAGGHLGTILAYQALALGITIFGFLTCLAIPLLGVGGAAAVTLVGLVALACGQSLGLGGLRRLHAALLPLGAGAAALALVLAPAVAGPAAAPQLGGQFLGLLVPTLVGFLLGPWLEVQHWHRAVHIRRQGGSLAVAYGVGGALFIGLISLNAMFTIGLPASAGLHVNVMGAADATHVLALSLAEGDSSAPIALFALWAAIAVATTLDSGWAATRWLMAGVTSASRNPLLAMVPPGLVQTPLWVFLSAVAIAAAGTLANLFLLDLMAPYATLFVGSAACVVLQATRKARSPDGTLCTLLGLASVAAFGIGFYADLHALTAVSPLVALVAALPLMRAAPVEPATTAPQAGAAPAPTPANDAAAHPALAYSGAGELSALKGHFDGEWFNLAYTPTYDDTNSVGNVYWANYCRWVGKAREMFFARCLPNFDLKSTEYFILTKRFTHDFKSESKEFEASVIRLRVGKHNRKFATLEHEIRTVGGRLLGKGEQQLMFVSVGGYQLIDIPGEVLSGFMPFFPKGKVA